MFTLPTRSSRRSAAGGIAPAAMAAASISQARWAGHDQGEQHNHYGDPRQIGQRPVDDVVLPERQHPAMMKQIAISYSKPTMCSRVAETRRVRVTHHRPAEQVTTPMSAQ